MSKRWRCGWILCLVFLTTGCWDRVEIENRGFVIGVAIDAAKEKQAKETEEKEAPSKPKGKQRFVATHQFVVPGALKGQGGGGGQQGGGQGGDAFLNLSSEGNTMFEIARTFATRTSRSPYLEHLKIIIVSEELAKKGQFAHVLDFFLRNHEMRRTTKIMIAKGGEARKVLEVTPKNEKLPVLDYLNQEHYSTWKTIKDDWDHGQNYFAKSKIRIQAKVKLRNIGNVNQTVK